MDTIQTEIGKRIKSRRESLGLSQEAVAMKLGYKSRSTINKIELGKINLRQSKIKAIADALETTPSFIMGWRDNPDEPPKKKKPSEVDELMSMFMKLNKRGRDRIRSDMEILLESPKYTRSDDDE